MVEVNGDHIKVWCRGMMKCISVLVCGSSFGEIRCALLDIPNANLTHLAGPPRRYRRPELMKVIDSKIKIVTD